MLIVIGILDHFGIPSTRRPVYPDILIASGPGKTVARFRIPYSITLLPISAIVENPSVRIKHLVEAILMEHGGPGDRFGEVVVVYAYESRFAPVNTIKRVRILDQVSWLGRPVDDFPSGAGAIPHLPFAVGEKNTGISIEEGLVKGTIADG